MSKFIKLYTLNMYRSLYVNYTSINLFKEVVQSHYASVSSSVKGDYRFYPIGLFGQLKYLSKVCKSLCSESHTQ